MKCREKDISFDMRVDNLSDFRKLLNRRKKEAEQLEKTLAQLQNFDFKISSKVHGINQIKKERA